MKVLILGIGAQGSVIANEISQNDKVSEVICGDINLRLANELVKSNAKITTKRVDAKNTQSIIEAARGVAIIVNALPPVFNIDVMNAALKVNAHYQDLASGPIEGLPFEQTVMRQLEQDKKWKEKSLTALIHTGTAPGIANVLARRAADSLDVVKRIRLLFYGALETKRFIPFWWEPATAWGDMVKGAIVWRNGNYEEVPPVSGEEMYDFPRLGPQKVVWHEHEEPITLPIFIGKGLEYCDFKMGGSTIELAIVFHKYGLLSTNSIRVKGMDIKPFDVVLALTPPAPQGEEVSEIIKEGILREEGERIIEAEGEKDGRKTLIRYSFSSPGLEESFKRLRGSTSQSYITGLSAAAFTKLLIEDKVGLTGVFPPECLGTEAADIVLQEIAKKGIIVAEVN